MAKTSSSKKIWVHTIVKNEENYIYFALMSVVDFVDKILVWDTGSTDATVKIINEVKKIKGDKIDFKEIGSVNKIEFTAARQKMLDESKCDWLLILDGDEVWPQQSIELVIKTINENDDGLNAIIVPFYNLIGDLYHIQDKSAGEYRILGNKGFITIRALNRKIPGLHLSDPYPFESYSDKDNIPLQKGDPKKLFYQEAPYLHFTHLKRSSLNLEKRKIKYDLGKPLPKGFQYPKILLAEIPTGIINPWQKRSFLFVLISTVKYLLTFVRRRIKNKL